MAENKTKQTDASVEAFINKVDDEEKRKDSFTILALMKKITGAEPKMWGDSIIGFGNIHYKSKSGREGDWFLVGFSPRKQNLTLYLSYGFEKNEELMQKFGKYKVGKACLYFKKIDDIDIKTLEKLIRYAIERNKIIYNN